MKPRAVEEPAEPTSEEWGAILLEGLKVWAIVAAFALAAIVGWLVIGAVQAHGRACGRTGIDSKKNDR